MAEIEAVFEEHQERYGSPRITRELRARGVRIGRHRVRRLMQLGSLRARPRRRRRVRTTDSRHAHPVAPNLLNRQFTVDAPNRVWAADLTYLPTRQGWLYLAVVIDLFSRAVVGWSMSRRIDQKLALDALDAALGRRKPPRGLIVHSDQGVQYAAIEYQNRLASLGAVCSMSRKGNCWDNAVVESFFATLKSELLEKTAFENQRVAQTSVFSYIESYYNRQRRHSTLAYVSPMEYERRSSFA